MQTASVTQLKVNLKPRGIHCTSHLLFQNIRNRNCYALCCQVEHYMTETGRNNTLQGMLSYSHHLPPFRKSGFKES